MRKLTIILVAVLLAPACKKGIDKIQQVIGGDSSQEGKPVCPGADKIKIFDSHINMAPEAYPKVLKLNDDWRVYASINVMGGSPGWGLEDSEAILLETKGKIQFMCNIDWTIFGKDYFVKKTLEDLEKCKEKGGVGLKIFKSLGLGVEWPDGTLLKVDDPILDPIFDKCGELNLVVLIHSGDPKAFFEPFSEKNERFEELDGHPSWRFDDRKLYPTWEEVYKQFLSRVARHPKTRIIGSHFGNNPEDPATVFKMMGKYPNLYANTSARIPEIGRFDAKKMQAFIEKFPDRVIYGSDLGVGPKSLILGSSPPSRPTENEIIHFFTSSYRYFETRDKQFEHCTPIQGKWKIDGIGLPCDLLKKVYFQNSEKLYDFKIKPPD